MACELNSSINRQLGLKVQVDCETPAIIEGEDFKVRAQQSPEFTLEVDMVENNEAKQSFTKTGNIAGIKRMGATFDNWTAGSGGDTDVNELDVPLRLCGLSSIFNATISVDIGSIAGAFTTFSTLTGGTSGAVAKLMFVDRTNSLIVIEVISGSFTGGGEVLTDGAGFSITSLAGEVAKSGQRNYYPKSDNFEFGTYRQEGDGFAWEGYSVAGNLEMSAEAGQAVVSTFTFAGKSASYKASGITGLSGVVAVGETVTDGTNTALVVSPITASNTYFNYEVTIGVKFPDSASLTFSGTETATTNTVGYEPIGDRPFTAPVVKFSTNPPIALCAKVRIEGVDLDFQNFSFSMGNELEEVLSMASCSGVKLGAIGDRRPSFSFNPLLVKSSDWNVYKDWEDGKKIDGFAIIFDKGENNRFAIVIDKLQIQGNTNGEQTKKTTFDIEADIISSVNNQEFAIVFY